MIRVLIPLLVLLAACTTPIEDETRDGSGPITFVDGRDTTDGGQVAKMVDRWNARAGLDEQVDFVQMPSSTDAHRAQLTARAQDLAGVPGSPDCYDVMAVDMVWTAEFAAAGHLEPLDPGDFGVDRMLPQAVEAARSPVGGTRSPEERKLWAVPWRADAGFLYYRKDVLERAGLQPPTTWAELRRQATEVAPRHGLQGYVGQFRRYEGLIVNAAEAIWAHDGDLERPDDPRAKAGVRALAEGIEQGWIPRAALDYDENASLDEFKAGRALFMRNWPYAGPVLDGKDSDVIGEWERTTLPGTSALGGWNLAVSRCSAHQQTARKFIRFVVDDANQRLMFEHAGFGPTSTALYRDPELEADLAPLWKSLRTARLRPTSAHYDELTSVMQENLHHALGKPESVDSSLDVLAAELAKAKTGR
ncbi:ABC transporter substrate-binding protein [Saccharothrix isguenensis]